MLTQLIARLRKSVLILTGSMRESKGGLVVLALIVGVGAGLGAIVFRWLIKTFTELLSGHADYSAVGHALNPHVPWLGRWFVVLAPVVAGLLYGPLVQRFAKEARGHGVPEVMYAVRRRGGRIGPQVAVVKSLASALCIGGGGSVGREGPIVQIGSALGSSIGTLLRVDEDKVRTLVACGAGGGIAATFNAPLAGVFFAMELILRDFEADAFGMVVLATVTASVIGRAAFGDTPFIQLPVFTVGHNAEYLLFVLLGVLAGAIGVAFSKILYAVEDLCDFLWRGPEWLRPAVGGFFLGGLLLLLPEMYGVGYPVMHQALSGSYVVGFLLILLFGKILATSLTIGIGGSGGVFAPSLFMGAMFGVAYGLVTHMIAPGIAGPMGAYGLIGMGAAFAGAARAPITAVIIMFELTGEYSIILPLMAAIVVATLVSRWLTRDTIYTLKLLRRGVDLDAPLPHPALRGVNIKAIMEHPPKPLAETASTQAVANALSRSVHGALPVIARDGVYLGIVTIRNFSDAMASEPPVPLRDIVQRPPIITAKDSVIESLDALIDSDGAGLPVMKDERGELVGWVTHQNVLARIHRSAAKQPHKKKIEKVLGREAKQYHGLRI